MTIKTKEPEVPSEFPPARLFLDDIDEIVRILREFTETRQIDSHSTVEDLKIKVVFSVGGKECDDVQDLPKIANSRSELSILVSRGDWLKTSLYFRPWSGTIWLSPGLTKEAAWSAFHKLDAVFQKRIRRWSALLRSLPWWLKWPPIYVLLILIPLLRFPLYRLMPHGPADVTVLVFYGAFFIAVTTVILIGARHTRLVLRHSWDQSPFRQYMKDKLVPVIVRAVIGIGGTILTFYLRHKYWP